MKYKIREEIGNHFLDHAVKLVKEGNICHCARQY